MSTIAENLQAVNRRIAQAMRGAPRPLPRLVAVSKTRPAEDVREAFAAGCRDFGENYVQDALPKIAALRDLPATWHFIGALQTNKAKEVAAHFDWFHAVDRLRIAEALSKHRDPSRPLNVCLQANISGEATKGGVEPGDVEALAREVAALPGLKVRGLMGMAEPTEDVALQRGQFARLREAFEALRAAGFDVDTLSMGMTQDFEAAIAEGSTLVRIGTAIFGEREKKAKVA